jgi:hypothetical protein
MSGLSFFYWVAIWCIFNVFQFHMLETKLLFLHFPFQVGPFFFYNAWQGFIINYMV